MIIKSESPREDSTIFKAVKHLINQIKSYAGFKKSPCKQVGGFRKTTQRKKQKKPLKKKHISKKM